RPGVEGAAGGAPERRVVVGAEQALEPRLLAGSGEGPPVVPGDALLALDHQADAHGPTLTVARRPGAELPQRRGGAVRGARLRRGGSRGRASTRRARRRRLRAGRARR